MQSHTIASTWSYSGRKLPTLPRALIRTINVVDSHRLEEETALLLKVRETRDVSAFDALFARLSGKVLGYLVRSGGCSVDDGENLLQEIWCIVWHKAFRFEPSLASARTWIFTVARHVLIDFKRAHQREAGALAQYFAENADADTVSDPHAIMVDSETAATLLAQIPPEQALILQMAYIEGKSHRDIARELGLPAGTVKSRLRLGFAKLRELLAPASE